MRSVSNTKGLAVYNAAGARVSEAPVTLDLVVALLETAA